MFNLKKKPAAPPAPAATAAPPPAPEPEAAPIMVGRYRTVCRRGCGFEVRHTPPPGADLAALVAIVNCPTCGASLRTVANG